MKSSLAFGRFTAGVTDMVYLPQVNARPLPPLVFMTGGGTLPEESLDLFGGTPTMQALLDDGRPVVQPSVPWLLGNGTSWARIDAAVAYARANLGATNAPPILWGVSNGWACAISYARTHAVSGLVGYLTVVDGTDVYNDDSGVDIFGTGLRARIEAAFSITYPAPIPYYYDTWRDIAQWLPLGVKVFGAYAPDDQLYSGPQLSFLSQMQATMQSCGSNDHSAASVANIDVAKVMRFVKSVT